MSPAALSGFVLAGGASRRFGSDKAAWPRAGAPMAARVADALRPWCASVRIVRRPEQAARVWRGDGEAYEELRGEEGSRHPLWGVAAALAAADQERAMLAPCDLWDLSPALLAPLAAAEEGIAWDGTSHQPLLAVLRRDRLDTVRAGAAAGARVWEVLGDLPWIRLDAAALRQANERVDLPR